MDSSMFFDGWHGVVEVLVLGTLGYAALVVLLRLSRKRSLAQMNVFDFVYVVVIGEILAITIMDESVSLAEGLVGIVLLIGLQALLSWLTSRSPAMERVVNGEPTLLFHRGRYLRDAMRTERVSEEEILAAAREEGVADLEEVEAVVLETNGSFSVLHVGASSRRSSTLQGVPGARGLAGDVPVAIRPSRDDAYVETR